MVEGTKGKPIWFLISNFDLLAMSVIRFSFSMHLFSPEAEMNSRMWTLSRLDRFREDSFWMS